MPTPETPRRVGKLFGQVFRRLQALNRNAELPHTEINPESMPAIYEELREVFSALADSIIALSGKLEPKTVVKLKRFGWTDEQLSELAVAFGWMAEVERNVSPKEFKPRSNTSDEDTGHKKRYCYESARVYNCILEIDGVDGPRAALIAAPKHREGQVIVVSTGKENVFFAVLMEEFENSIWLMAVPQADIHAAQSRSRYPSRADASSLRFPENVQKNNLHLPNFIFIGPDDVYIKYRRVVQNESQGDQRDNRDRYLVSIGKVYIKGVLCILFINCPKGLPSKPQKKQDNLVLRTFVNQST